MQLTDKEFDMITEIMIKIEQIKSLESDGSRVYDYSWDEPASPKDFDAFEKEHHVELPRDYKIFLSYISNGGPFVGKGLYPLHKSIAISSLSKESIIYPHMSASELQTIHDTIEKDLMKDPSLELYIGILIIGEANEDQSYALIITGEYKGQFLTINNNSDHVFNFSYNIEFLKLYSKWLDACLDEKNNKNIFNILEKDEKNLIVDYKSLDDFIFKEDILNTLETHVSLSEITQDTLKLLYKEEKDLKLKSLTLILIDKYDKEYSQTLFKQNLRALEENIFDNFVRNEMTSLDFDSEDYKILSDRLLEASHLHYEDEEVRSAYPYSLALETLCKSECFTYTILEPFLFHENPMIVEITLQFISKTIDFRSHKKGLNVLLDHSDVVIIRAVLQVLIDSTMTDEYVELFRPVLNTYQDDLLIPSYIERYLYKIKKPLDYYSEHE